jgi:hypothetical protein
VYVNVTVQVAPEQTAAEFTETALAFTPDRSEAIKEIAIATPSARLMHQS